MGDSKKQGEARSITSQKLDKIKKEEEINNSSLTFTGRLQEARKSKHLTQEEAANGLNMKLGTYQKIEQGKNRKSAAQFIRQFADYYNVSTDYLLGLSNTQHPDYDTVIAKTGLNEKSIGQLIEFFLQDGDDPSPGYIDFINCFLGNEKSTSLFFQSIMPLLNGIYKYKHTEERSERMARSLSNDLADAIFDYMDKVVIPTYGQLRETGSYTPVPSKEYMTDEAVKKK